MANKFTTEERLNALEQKYTTLYNRAYARNIRRTEAYNRETELVKNWVKRMEGLPVHKLAALCTRIKNGRQLMTLDAREYQLLKGILSGRIKTKKSNYVFPENQTI